MQIQHYLPQKQALCQRKRFAYGHYFIQKLGIKMQEMTLNEIDEVSGAVTKSQVLNYGAAVCAVGGAVLLATGSPLLVAAGAAYGIASGGMWLASAMMDMK